MSSSSGLRHSDYVTTLTVQEEIGVNKKALSPKPQTLNPKPQTLNFYLNPKP